MKKTAVCRIAPKTRLAYSRFMQYPIQSMLLVTKEHNPQALAAATLIADWLKEGGVHSRQVPTRLDSKSMRAEGKDMDLALVLGGDGALLGVARALTGLHIPIAGINYGRVGFLAGIGADNWMPELTAILDGRYIVQEHLALAWKTEKDGVETASGWSVNDVVVARGQVARAISLDLTVNGVFLSRLRCDGVIVSAPLGTTAYAASAHGPLAFPSLDVQIITPISPFAGAFPPLVLPAEADIRLVSRDPGLDVIITVDGQEVLPLLPGETLSVQGVPGTVPLLVRDHAWYLPRLVERGFILPGPGQPYLPVHDED